MLFLVKTYLQNAYWDYFECLDELVSLHMISFSIFATSLLYFLAVEI